MGSNKRFKTRHENSAYADDIKKILLIINNYGENYYKRKSSKRCKEYWMNKGYSEEDAKQKVSEFQRKSSKRCKEYWMNKGYSEEDAIKAVSEYQDMSSLNSLIKRHGEKLGVEKYNSMYRGWQYQYWMNKGYSEEDAKQKVSELQAKCAINNKNISKFELTLIEIFIKLDFYDYLHQYAFKINKTLIKQIGIINNYKQYFVVDYYLPKHNLIIEMDGTYWHKNCKELDKIRDGYFKQLGLNTLRIDQLEWNKLTFKERIELIKENLNENIKIN